MARWPAEGPAGPFRADVAGVISGEEAGVAGISDEELWAPFLASRTPDRPAARMAARAGEDPERRQRHPPRRAAALSREEIVRAAIRVADAEGADAVSMRRIARELNAGTMSLYWHVGSKEELLDLMIDTLQGDREPPGPSGDWKRDLRAMALGMRASFHEHRWMMDFLGGRPPSGPRSLRNLERGLAYFDGLELGTGTAIDIVTTVATYVMGAVLREVQEHNNQALRDQQFAGVPPERFGEVIADFIGRLRDSGRFPRIVVMFEEGYDPDAPESRDRRFEFGLDCLLDGIGARLAGPPAP